MKDNEFAQWVFRVMHAARQFGDRATALKLLWEDLLGPMIAVEQPCRGEGAYVRADASGKNWCIRIGAQWWQARAPKDRTLKRQIEFLNRLQSEVTSMEKGVEACAAAAKAAQQMSRQNNLLLQAVAALHHDFGNVLNPLLGRLALLQRQSATLPPDIQKELEVVFGYIPLARGMVSRSKEALARLLGEQDADLETVDLGETVQTFFGNYLARQAELRKGKVVVRWELPLGIQVRMSTSGFFQAFWNVLHNALKFTREGEVAVLVRKSPTMGWVEIHDTGPGIPEKDRKRLMEGAFGYRGQNAAVAPGTGIGLWVTVLLVRGMGGKTVLMPRKPHGTTVSLGFPLAEKDLGVQEGASAGTSVD